MQQGIQAQCMAVRLSAGQSSSVQGSQAQCRAVRHSAGILALLHMVPCGLHSHMTLLSLSPSLPLQIKNNPVLLAVGEQVRVINRYHFEAQSLFAPHNKLVGLVLVHNKSGLLGGKLPHHS